MPFYRCMPPSSGGGGGGGGDVQIWGINNNGVIEYPTSVGPGGLGYNANVNFVISPNVTNYANLFNGLSLYNYGPLNVPENVTNIDRMLASCSNFDQPVTFLGSNFNNASFVFSSCTKFNQHVVFPKNLNQMNSVFLQCQAFNQRVNFDAGNMQTTIHQCYNFNSRVLFGGNCHKLDKVFSYLNNFNQAIIVPSSVWNIPLLLRNCANFNSPILIKADNRVPNMAGNSLGIGVMENYYSEFNSDIIFTINTNKYTSFSFSTTIFSSKTHIRNTQKRVNIYIDNVDRLTAAGKVISTSPATTVTWSATTNGKYNAAYNIYLLSNVQDGINKFNQYYYDRYGEYPPEDF